MATAKRFARLLYWWSADRRQTEILAPNIDDGRQWSHFLCCIVLVSVLKGSPLVSSVLVSTEASCQVEGAVGSQAGIHPLGQVEDLRRRERLPLSFLRLQPAVTTAARSLISASDNRVLSGYSSLRTPKRRSASVSCPTCFGRPFWHDPDRIAPAGSRRGRTRTWRKWRFHSQLKPTRPLSVHGPLVWELLLRENNDRSLSCSSF